MTTTILTMFFVGTSLAVWAYLSDGELKKDLHIFGYTLDAADVFIVKLFLGVWIIFVATMWSIGKLIVSLF